MNDLSIKPKQVLLGLYRKEIWDNYQFTIVELFVFDRFFNWALSEQMAFIEIKDNRLFLIDYKTIAPSWGMTTFYLKKIMLHLSGSLPKDVSTNLKYPLIRITKQNTNNKWYSYYGFEKGVMNTIMSWETINPNRRKYLEGFVNNNGLFSSQDLIALNPPKYDKNKIIGKLLPKVESILIEMKKLMINDKKTLFSFTLPMDHNIHTESMKHFQSYLLDLHEGIFIKNNKVKDEFIERNNFYINDKSYNKIRECKGNWDKIYELLISSSGHFLTWFETGREPQSKKWLFNYRDIGTYMFDPMNKNSMFLVSLLKDSSSLREVIAENTYNRLPSYIQNKFIDFYNDEWDGLAYWNRIYSVYKWYKDNADDLIKENINYRYWLDGGIEKFMEEYYDFINNLGQKFLKHFGTKCRTWNWFINDKKEEHGINE
jgi:hypothetical protein